MDKILSIFCRILHGAFLVVAFNAPGLVSYAGETINILLTEVLVIGDSGGSMFDQVGDITVDGEENIYVTDRYQFKIKKFSHDGMFLAEYGTGGKREGEFPTGPGRIGLVDTTLIVSDIGTAKLILLTKRLRLVGEMVAPGPIVDIAECEGDFFIVA